MINIIHLALVHIKDYVISIYLLYIKNHKCKLLLSYYFKALIKKLAYLNPKFIVKCSYIKEQRQSLNNKKKVIAKKYMFLKLN